MGMDLEKFLSNSLVQVIDGIKDAQKRTSKDNIPDDQQKYFESFIVPAPAPASQETALHNFYFIEFDVETTVVSDSGKQGDWKIVVTGTYINLINGKLEVASNKNQCQRNTAVNRMKFKVPIIYPSWPKPHH